MSPVHERPQGANDADPAVTARAEPAEMEAR
jgi:hypothetical protein